MQSEGLTPSGVKWFSAKRRKIFRGKKRDKRTANLFYRLTQYARGCFEEGAHYKLQSELVSSFTNTTKFTLKHVQRQFANFRRNTTEFEFERVRIGRSWQVKILVAGDVESGVRMPEVTARLRGYIAATLKIYGCARVDLVFLRRFCETTGLPAEMAKISWERLRKFAGFRSRWRGEGGGRKFLIFRTSSPPQTSGGIGFPSERKIENSQPANAGSRTNEERPVAGHDGHGWGTEGFRASTPTDPDPLSKSPEAPGGTPSFAPRKTMAHPLHVCGRVITNNTLRPKAQWIAFVACKPLHLRFDRVRFRAAHALNFALGSLRLGHRAENIVAAYREGLETSHDNALDTDRLPGGGYAFQREPSETVVKAAGILHRKDPREIEARWADFFAAPRTPTTRPKVSGSVNFARADLAAPKTARSDRRSSNAENGAVSSSARLTPKEAAERLAELRVKIARPKPAPGEAAGITQNELMGFLRTRGITMIEYLAYTANFKATIRAQIITERGK